MFKRLVEISDGDELFGLNKRDKLSSPFFLAFLLFGKVKNLMT